MAAPPGASMPRCVFCGAQALVQSASDAVVPVQWLRHGLDVKGAEDAARAHLGRSWFSPPELRSTALTLDAVLVPAWWFEGELRTAWTGLVSAMTRSGKRPVDGQDRFVFDQILVPASAALTPGELATLGRFPTDGFAPWDPDAAEVPWEVGERSERSARDEAVAQAEARHGEQIQAREGLLTIRTSSVPERLSAVAVLIPVWICAYEHEGGAYRLVVHGTDRRAAGKVPLDPKRVALAVVLGLVVVAVVVAILAYAGVG